LSKLRCYIFAAVYVMLLIISQLNYFVCIHKRSTYICNHGAYVRARRAFAK
jgi:hypothetical protein